MDVCLYSDQLKSSFIVFSCSSSHHVNAERGSTATCLYTELISFSWHQIKLHNTWIIDPETNTGNVEVGECRCALHPFSDMINAVLDGVRYVGSAPHRDGRDKLPPGHDSPNVPIQQLQQTEGDVHMYSHFSTEADGLNDVY